MAVALASLGTLSDGKRVSCDCTDSSGTSPCWAQPICQHTKCRYDGSLQPERRERRKRHDVRGEYGQAKRECLIGSLMTVKVKSCESPESWVGFRSLVASTTIALYKSTTILPVLKPTNYAQNLFTKHRKQQKKRDILSELAMIPCQSGVILGLGIVRWEGSSRFEHL